MFCFIFLKKQKKGNNCGDVGIIALSKILSSNQTLLNIDLTSNFKFKNLILNFQFNQFIFQKMKLVGMELINFSKL